MSGKQLLVIIASMAVLAFPVLAGAKTTIKMMYQGQPEYSAMYESVAKRFEVANPEVHVEMIYAAHDEYAKKLGAAILAKQVRDLFMIDAPFLANYVWSGHLRPLKPLLDKDILEDMTRSSYAQGTYPPGD